MAAYRRRIMLAGKLGGSLFFAGGSANTSKPLPITLDTLMQEDLDVVVGSRYLAGGGIGEWNESRAVISRFAARLSRIVVRAELSDPMSGFFYAWGISI